jgi:uncharacterized protein YecA (UPF0149 family)
MKPEPLNDAEFDRLNSVLARFGDKHSMNLEKLDGFLAALICGPDTVLPSEYLPAIWGDDIVLENTFKAQPLLHDFLALIMRHMMSNMADGLFPFLRWHMKIVLMRLCVLIKSQLARRCARN